MNRGDRLHALDSLRAFALLLGVVHHATLSFIPGVQAAMAAPVEDSSPSATLAIVSFVGHVFRMSLFFMMAGFFARMMVQRKGLDGFWADRLQRILTPLIVGWIVLFPIVSAVWSWGLTGSFSHSPLLVWPPSISNFPLSYLWFLYYLLILYALWLGARGAIKAVDATGRVGRAADECTRRILESGWVGVTLLTAPLGALLLTQSNWLILGGINTPNASLIPQPVAVFGYGMTFALGWMLNRNVSLLWLWRDRWRGYLAAAVLATALALLIALAHEALAVHSSMRLARLVFALSYAFASWCWIFGLTGFALTYLSEPSTARRYVADASYWVYLVHYPIVLAVQDVIANVRWHWTLKFPVMLAVTLAISFATYHYLVRYTIIGRVLNGRRLKPSREPALPASSPTALPASTREISGS